MIEIIQSYGHAVFEWSMVIALFVAIWELRSLQAKMKEVHRKVCCNDDKHEENMWHV